MFISASSIFMTLVMVSGMILFLRFLLGHKKAHFFGRPDILVLLSLIILLRLCLPVEFPFTISIAFSKLMNPLQAFLRYEIYGIRIGKLLLIVWGIGSLFACIFYLQKLMDLKRIQGILKRNSKIYKVSDFMDVCLDHDFTVWKTPLVTMPMVLGFQKVILLPDIDLDQEEMESVLSHEIQHILNHDMLIQQVLNILLILYWWFLPVYLLKREIRLAMELRVDEKVTHNMSRETVLNYASSLVSLKKKFAMGPLQKELASSSSFLLYDDARMLSYRVRFLMDAKWSKRTNKFLLAAIISFSLLSHSVILEPYHPDTGQNDGVWTEEELLEKGILIHHKDDTYTLHIEGQEATLKDISQPPFNEMKVLEET